MASRIYWANALTGGAAGSLDAIDVADSVGDGTYLALSDGDQAIVIFSNAPIAEYYYDSDSGSAENSPLVIAPDTSGGVAYTGDGRWILANDNVMYPGWFGAVGDGTTNDTTAIQAAIDAAKTNGKRVHFPAGTYLVTSSLDCTFASGTAGLILSGDGRTKSIIYGNLTEEYPIIDFTGNTRGQLEGLKILGHDDGKATACLLCAKPAAGGGQGNNVSLRDCHLEIPVDDDTYADTALVVYNSDLTRIENSEVYGPAGASFGFGKSAAVDSKYQTLSAVTDSTMFWISDTIFNSDSGPALKYTGGAAIDLRGCYFALVGTGSSDVILVDSTTTDSGNSVYAYGIRVENQSAATAVNAIHFADKTLGGHISGHLETDSIGILIYIDSGMEMFRYDINVLNSYADTTALFAGGGDVHESIIKTNVWDLGTVAAGSGATNQIYSGNIYPILDDTSYLGKPDDDSPRAWKALVLKDTANGKYYKIMVTNGAVTAYDLTD